MKFFIAGADDIRFYLIRRTNLNLMFTAGHFWDGKKFREPTDITVSPNLVFVDSGAFQLFGKYKDYPFTPQQYINFISKVKPNYYASMDYPCEQFVRQKIGVTVKQAVDKTIENLTKLIDTQVEKSTLVPVIQGWEPSDYVYCIDRLKEQGMLKEYMGIGTLCRRGKTPEILKIIKVVKNELPAWVKLHGFGVKISILKHPMSYKLLTSCDSASWVSLVAHGEVCIFTGKKLLRIPYQNLDIDPYERLSISLNGYLQYVEYLISKHEKNKSLDEYLANEWR